MEITVRPADRIVAFGIGQVAERRDKIQWVRRLSERGAMDYRRLPELSVVFVLYANRYFYGFANPTKRSQCFTLAYIVCP